MREVLFVLVLAGVVCFVALDTKKPKSRINVIDRMPTVAPVTPVAPTRRRRDHFHHRKNYFKCTEPNIFGG
jgi:hypothetical protein